MKTLIKDLNDGQFDYIEEIRDFNQEKVLNAFIDNKVSPEHFYTVSGYGHDDMGKETLDNVFAQVFSAEKAIVRNHFVSGTRNSYISLCFIWKFTLWRQTCFCYRNAL